VEPVQYLEFLRADGEALAAAAADAPDAAIPTCEEWDMTALVVHAGGVHHWVERIVTTRATEYIKRDTAPPPGFDATLAWYDKGLQSLLSALAATDPDEMVWNWRDRRAARAAFWFRRMAQETAIHRWDAQNAAGDRHPVAADLAVDGIDEYLSFVGPWLAREPIEGLHGSLHLHATDTAGEWSIDLRPDGLDLAREHRKSDAAIRAPASDLYLFLLNRVTADGPSFQCFGDDAIVASWRQVRF
jgi:uncharacterized protein (TIGR03083 family)